MNFRGALIAAAMLILLGACGQEQQQTTAPARTVPTSPNAAYQTTFPESVTSGATVLEPGTAEATTPGPTTSASAPANEEVTVSPVTIPIEQTTATP